MSRLVARHHQSSSTRLLSASQAWALDDVISISSDSESDIDDGDERDEDDWPYGSQVDEPHSDDSLPSISAIAASLAGSQRACMTGTGTENPTQVLHGADIAGDPEGSVSSATDKPHRAAGTSSGRSFSVPSSPAESSSGQLPSMPAMPVFSNGNEAAQDHEATTCGQDDLFSTIDSFPPSRQPTRSMTPRYRCDETSCDVEDGYQGAASRGEVGLSSGKGSSSATTKRTTNEPGDLTVGQKCSNEDDERHYRATDGFHPETEGKQQQ
ncbi:hypothetical protein TOPH_08124 [Tolypocladium ophioglossoides CBS 100239]|uniref:Uncharacterized protein n=1 Tax=Tolypocladium ophioglossoides (strain CBS 100239) TaxID=1163406 RepID=A0A0L0MZJ5_TOLOC|nr:hypothetical protein TOPH_08124 [Tolypocladium ophioglossoides CBS 100239]